MLRRTSAGAITGFVLRPSTVAGLGVRAAPTGEHESWGATEAGAAVARARCGCMPDAVAGRGPRPLAGWVHTRETAHMLAWTLNGTTPPGPRRTFTQALSRAVRPFPVTGYGRPGGVLRPPARHRRARRPAGRERRAAAPPGALPSPVPARRSLGPGMRRPRPPPLILIRDDALVLHTMKWPDGRRQEPRRAGRVFGVSGRLVEAG